MYDLIKTPPKALVIHCADPRFQAAFREFITKELGLDHYAPLVVGGGGHALGNQTGLPAHFETIRDQIRFFVEEQGLKQIIIINHEDCQWYDKLKDHHPDTLPRDKGRQDLNTASKILLDNFDGLTVRIYWAALKDGVIDFVEVS